MTDLRLALRRSAARVRLMHHVVADLGLPTVGLVVANSVRRSAQERQRAADRSGPELHPGQLTEAHAEAGGLVCEFENARLEVRFLTDDVVRLSWEPGTAPAPYGVVDPLPWGEPVTTATPVGSSWTCATDALEVIVGPGGALAFSRPGGPTLRRESTPARYGTSWELRYEMRANESFTGLGVQAGPVDLRGGRYRLWNRDAGGAWGPGVTPLYLGIPVVYASHAEGDVVVFYENTYRGTFDFGGPEDDRRRAGTASATFSGGMLRYYVMVGEPSALMDRLSALTGRPALPPRWALGYHQSRWGYRTEADVREVVTGFAGRGLPLSAVHLDIDYMDGYRVFTVDKSRFPDLGALTSDVAERGARVVTIIDPGVKVDPAYALYRQGAEGGHFCVGDRDEPTEGVVWPGRAVFPDFTDPFTRQWWAGQYQTLTDAGVAGIWHDMNEPTSIAVAGDPTLPDATRHSLEGRGGDHAEAHNVYGLMMNRAGYAGLRQASPDTRPFIVSRSGWAGLQKWAWCWTGDVKTSWEGLRQQIATVIGVSLSGQPYVGPDIGGFSGVPDAELYVRWLQMSVFMPFCRTHSVVGAPRREPWYFPKSVEAIIGAWIRLRYRLLPYLYTLAHEAAASGAPLVRPPWWRADDTVSGPADLHDVDDMFLLGDALLVAPITAAGAKYRPVPLPPGSWSSWWAGDNTAGKGGSTVAIESPLERSPVLVRAGSIVPLDDMWTDRAGHVRLSGDEPVDGASGTRRREVTASTLALDHAPGLPAFHCWPTAEGVARGRCIDDAGDGNGPTRRDELVLEGAQVGATATLRWTRTGTFAPPHRVRVVLHGFAASRALVDGKKVDIGTGEELVIPPFKRLRLDGLRPIVS